MTTAAQRIHAALVREQMDKARRIMFSVSPNRTFSSLSSAIKIALLNYETMADAAQAWGINKAYLSRLRSGAQDNPSDEVLEQMGIVRSVKYTVKP